MVTRESALKCLLISCFIVFFILAIELWPTLSYVHKTYFKETSFAPHARNVEVIPRIPRRIHQCYFNVNNDGLLDRYRFAQQSWMKLNPGFTYTLWNRSMIDKLVKENYPGLYVLYKNYPSWLNQDEVGRYVVMHHYGGVYADLDMECVENISVLIKSAFSTKRQVVLHLGDLDLASNDFFAAPPRHQFVEHVISGLSEANRWYVFPYANIMLTTGATFFHGRYRSYYYKGEILTLADSNKYFVHHHASSWHRWDGMILIWFYRRGYIIKMLLFVLLFCAGIKLYLLFKRRKVHHQRAA
ncbi:hypothetical protein FSP39_012341 [Pinctada imbricata]|uniref:Uncharacterized protein n=1 Tax=Pinctada imbricata TaxID=66713 RepID=A0AA88Y0A3_PINIB|nr:hypothetical protein FSP39_012341 [Pinctada imbricata]